jgi:hypothetical protein
MQDAADILTPAEVAALAAADADAVNLNAVPASELPTAHITEDVPSVADAADSKAALIVSPRITHTTAVVPAAYAKRIAAAHLNAVSLVAVTCAADIAKAAPLINDGLAILKEVEADRKALTQPHLDAQREIMACAKAATAPLVQAVDALKFMVNTYQMAEQARAQEEARKAAAAEVARQQAEAKAAFDAEQARIAAERAAAALDDDDTLDNMPAFDALPDAAPAVFVPPPVAVVVAPPPAPVKVAGLSSTFVVATEVVDAAAVPRALCSVDEKKVKLHLADNAAAIRAAIDANPQQSIVRDGIRYYLTARTSARR